MNNISCILTVIKDEQEYLDEWIKYHLDLGVDHIFIFEDVDSTSHIEICDKYKRRVTLNSVLSILNKEDRDKALELNLTKKWNAQHLYFKNGLKYIKERFKNVYDWCFIIDVDEFITFEKEDTKLTDIFNLFDEYDAFIMQWKCYGANGYVNKPDYSVKGVVDTYTSEITGKISDTSDSFIKTCHNLKRYKDEFFHNQHLQSSKSNWCNTDFKKDIRPCYKHIYLKHFITKSWEEYVWKMKERGFIWGGRRDYDFFFKANQDMENKKEKLINEVKQEQLVVLTYKQSGSQGNEIRISLKGWRKFCTFNYCFIVIGTFTDGLKNEFPWVEFIECPQIEKVDGQYNQHLDVQHCMEIVKKKYNKTYDGFIWIADDNYAIKPFKLEDITTVHNHSSKITGNEKSPKNYWNYDKWKTGQMLLKANLPIVNYTTHYPCYFEFSKLEEIWDKFNMRNESYVLEDVYFNYFKHEDPILDSKIRLGIWSKEIYERDFQKSIENPNIKFMCNSVEGWCKELENDLEKIVK